jgi:hypothetical protein
MPCTELFIQSVTLDKKYFRVEYCAADTIEKTAESVKRTIRDSLAIEHGFIMNIPFCVALKENVFTTVMEDESLFKQLKDLKSANNWSGIIRLFEPLEAIKTKPHLWNNSFLLDTLSFAAAKLSETYINIRRTYINDNEREAFLNKQSRMRSNTINLRERLIGLKPGNPGYYSNLGYSYYQFCIELSLPGGRRDGKIPDDAEKALLNINKALAIDPNRIPDLYRKGQILTRILPPNLLFRGGSQPSPETIKSVREKINEGIKCFQKAEEVYEIIPLVDEKSLIRYRKEYIKSLYDVAGAYSDLVNNGWNYRMYIEEEQKDESPNNNYITRDIQLLGNAISYILKCIEKDNTSKRTAGNSGDITLLGACDGSMDGVYKLYSGGKYYFQKYLLLCASGNQSDSGNSAVDARGISEKYLRKALNFPWKREKARQSKGFIAERLARLLITKKDFTGAMNVLENIVKGKTDYYIRYTYALAAYRAGKFTDAKNQLEQAMSYPKANKDIGTGYYMLYYVMKSLGDDTKAQEYFQKSKTAA